MTIEAGSFVLPSAVPIILFALLPFVLLAIVRAREKAEKSLGANGADGISNIEHVAIGNRAGRRQRS